MILCPDCHSQLPSLDADACQSCGFAIESVDGIPVLLSSRDRQTQLFQDYLSLYEGIAAADLEASIQPTEYLRLKAERFFAHLGDLRGRRILEVGVGQGMLFEQVQQAGPRELIGVDIAPEYLRVRAQAGGEAVRVAVANVENLPFAGRFDVVVASDVLEHVLGLPDALVSIHRALAPGGRLVLDLPYRENLLQYSRLLGCPHELVHLRTFDRRVVLDLLNDGGFQVEHIGYDGFLPGRERRLINLDTIGGRVYRWLIERRFGNLAGVSAIDPRLGRYLIRPATIIAVARKSPGVEHEVVPPVRYAELDAAGRSASAPDR
jgi:SAM-dependent methyltransferase